MAAISLFLKLHQNRNYIKWAESHIKEQFGEKSNLNISFH